MFLKHQFDQIRQHHKFYATIPYLDYHYREEFLLFQHISEIQQSRLITFDTIPALNLDQIHLVLPRLSSPKSTNHTAAGTFQ